ncbi:MAG: Holliday junction branch migration DNA helicase RuvB [Oscillospiraceae bacterium]|nr:Holliday junction branch migration DNA helicase RuvB [Oscillospiraceae bacterium]
MPIDFNDDNELELEERVISTRSTTADENELSLRPQSLDEYLGQEKLKENLSIYIEAARMRSEPLDHALFYGPPGLGKTSLAHVIAKEMGVNMRATSGPVLERPGDLAAILNGLQAFDVLFIDEIHRLNSTVEEILYSAMEDFVIDIVLAKGQGASAIRMPIQKFTLVGATTRAGQIQSPLRARFGMVERLEMYSTYELMAIVKRSAGILSIAIEEDGSREIASRSRGTPRVANRLLRRVRDFAQVVGGGIITRELADHALAKMAIDTLGLDETDRSMLRSMIDNYGGGPVGLDTLAATINEESVTIEDVYEPYLLQMGFLNRTPRGRVVTRKAYEHLGLTYISNDGQMTL